MKKLYRSAKDKKIAGICGGLGELFEIDSNIIRLLYVLLALLTAILPFVVIYLFGWWLIPERNQ